MSQISFCVKIQFYTSSKMRKKLICGANILDTKINMRHFSNTVQERFWRPTPIFGVALATEN